MSDVNMEKLSGQNVYYTWNAIKNRCYNPNCKSYKDYGGRGIKMCDEWKNSSRAFRDWANDNGYKKGFTIERIDNDGDYCPENCTWIPKSEQVNNRRNNILYTYDGRTQNLSQWCKELGLDYMLMHNRIRMKGWSFERAVTTPVCNSKRNRRSKKWQNLQ